MAFGSTSRAPHGGIWVLAADRLAAALPARRRRRRLRHRRRRHRPEVDPASRRRRAGAGRGRRSSPADRRPPASRTRVPAACPTSTLRAARGVPSCPRPPGAPPWHSAPSPSPRPSGLHARPAVPVRPGGHRHRPARRPSAATVRTPPTPSTPTASSAVMGLGPATASGSCCSAEGDGADEALDRLVALLSRDLDSGVSAGRRRGGSTTASASARAPRSGRWCRCDRRCGPRATSPPPTDRGGGAGGACARRSSRSPSRSSSRRGTPTPRRSRSSRPPR